MAPRKSTKKGTKPAPAAVDFGFVGFDPGSSEGDATVEHFELSDKCPVCSGVLEVQGEYYKCSDHYLIVKQSFETAWRAYLDKMDCTNVFEDQQAAGQMLMDMLLNTNVAENKPLIKNLWIRSDKSNEQD